MPKSVKHRTLSVIPEASDAPVVIRTQEYIAAFPLNELEEFPGNPKDHDIGAIAESMERNGFGGAILAQRRGWKKPGSKSHPRIIAGHGRKQTLLAKGVTHAPVILVDMDDEAARRFVVADNRTGQLGGYDEGLLLDFLRPLALADDLRGTGYLPEHVDDLTQLFEYSDGVKESREVDAAALTSTHACPRCGFEFSKGTEKQTPNGSLALMDGDAQEQRDAE